MKESSGLRWIAFVRPAVGLFIFVHKGIDVTLAIKCEDGIESFEIINPLPVPLDEGILDVDAYIKKGDETVYSKFLQDYSPDVIHIHTLMGLHKEFIHAANELGIRTVFTTHDYFGLCPKVTLFHNGKPCDNDHNCMDCVKCNQSALSLKKIVVLQSPVYRKLKNTRVVKLLRSRHRKNFFEETETETAASAENTNVAQNQNYEKLREYYVSMLKMMDFIHFNSSVTEMIYNRYFHPKNSAVISITHRDIPRIAKLFHDKETEQMRQYIQQSYQFVWIIGIPIMMGVMAIADTFVPVFYGSGYDKIKILLPIYSLSVIPVALSNVTGCQFLIPTKKQNVYSAAVWSFFYRGGKTPWHDPPESYRNL